MLCDDAQPDLFATCTDQYRRVGLLQRFGIEARILQFEILAAEICPFLAPQQLNHPECFVEPPQPADGSMKRNAILLMLKLEPPRAQPENQPAAADNIHCRRHLG